MPVGGGTAGSRSLQLGGAAVHQASVELVEVAKQRAAQALEANPDDIVLDKIDGRFHVAGTPSAGWRSVRACPLAPTVAASAATTTAKSASHHGGRIRASGLRRTSAYTGSASTPVTIICARQ